MPIFDFDISVWRTLKHKEKKSHHPLKLCAHIGGRNYIAVLGKGGKGLYKGVKYTLYEGHWLFFVET